MTLPETIRVFVDGRGVDLPRGASAIDAVAAIDPALATAVRLGDRIVTDSRGLPIDAATPISGGAILRLIPRRDRSARPEPV